MPLLKLTEDEVQTLNRLDRYADGSSAVYAKCYDRDAAFRHDLATAAKLAVRFRKADCQADYERKAAAHRAAGLPCPEHRYDTAVAVNCPECRASGERFLTAANKENA